MEVHAQTKATFCVRKHSYDSISYNPYNNISPACKAGSFLAHISKSLAQHIYAFQRNLPVANGEGFPSRLQLQVRVTVLGLLVKCHLNLCLGCSVRYPQSLVVCQKPLATL